MQKKPNWIINLLLEEQINIIFGELSEFDDFEYYMKCVAKMRMKIQKMK